MNKIKLLIISLLAVINLTGCNPPEKDDNSVVVWHWMTDRHETFKKLAEKYAAETGKKVTFELNAPSDLFTTKVRAAAQTNTLPDVFGVLGGSQDFANFINSKIIHKLDPYLEAEDGKWKKSIFEKALKMSAFESDNQWEVEAGNYGVPIDVTNIQMIMNEDIMKEAGIETAPKTWDEFIKAGEAVISKTKAKFFVSGFGETWLINSMVRNFAYNLLGEEKYIKTLKGEYSYNSPEWIEIFSRFKEMADKKLFASGIVTMINKTAERLFATGRCAVTFNGSWCVNVYKGMNPKLNYKAIFFPSISENYPVVVQGGAGSSFVVNENSAKRDDAVAFLKWLTSKESQVFLANETNNLPANKEAVGEMPQVLNPFAKVMDNTIHPSFLSVAEDPSVDEAVARGVQSIIIGETTPEKLAEDLSKLKQKVLSEK